MIKDYIKVKLCDYGCGEVAIHRFKNGKWCCATNATKCKNHRQKCSERVKGSIPWNKGLINIYTKETINKMSQTRKLKYSGNKHPWYGKHHTEETRKKMSESAKKKIFTDEHRINISKSGMGRKWSDETRKKLDGRCMTGKQHTEETKRNHSMLMKILWKDDEYIKKLMSARHIFPNKPETFILSILDNTYPGEWKYTGDFSFMINGKNPDFVNCNGQKKIIELYGDYWHRNDNPQDRMDLFAKFGYQTLIIWESELKDETELVKKLKKFCTI
jgi:hypothetical protein